MGSVNLPDASLLPMGSPSSNIRAPEMPGPPTDDTTFPTTVKPVTWGRNRMIIVYIYIVLFAFCSYNHA